MTIPDYQTVMLPLLRLASDEQEHSSREAIEKLADQFELSEQERKELLPSGRQATFDNRVGWARTCVKKAGLLESKQRGYFKITSRGLEVLQKDPQTINVEFLEQYPELVEFRTKRTVADKPASTKEMQEDDAQTPEEAIEAAYQAIRNNLASDLIQQIMECSPPSSLNAWWWTCSSRWVTEVREKMRDRLSDRAATRV